MARNRNLKLGVGAVFASLGLGVVLLSAFEKPGISDLLIPGYVALIIGVYLCGMSILKFNVEKEDVFKQLTEHPEKIVWVYYYKVESMPYGVKILTMSTLYFHLLDKRKLSVRMSEKKANEVMNKLRNRLPRATFGYSVKTEQLFIANPALLLYY